jgi:tetratricopeptide (TPR) repeat protein
MKKHLTMVYFVMSVETVDSAPAEVFMSDARKTSFLLFCFMLTISVAGHSKIEPSTKRQKSIEQKLRSCPGCTAVYGQLIVKSKTSAHPPEYYVVTLRSLSPGSWVINGVGESSQVVGNLDSFRFLVAQHIGDFELIVSSRGRVLLQHPFTVDSTQVSEKLVNLLVEWKDESSWTLSHLRTISTNDFYSRNASSAELMNKEFVAAETGDFKEAVRLLKTIVEADPEDFEAWAELGTILFEQRSRRESNKAFERSLALRPSYPLALLNYGKSLYLQKSYDSSIRILNRLLSIHPEAAEAHRYLGEAFVCLKDSASAITELEKAASLDPQGQAEAHLSLAALYDLAGRKDKAAEEYETFLTLRPESPDNRKLKQYIVKNKKR